MCKELLGCSERLWETYKHFTSDGGMVLVKSNVYIQTRLVAKLLFYVKV